jgi:hypothetical protein
MLLSLLLLIFLRFSCYALELDAPPSRLLFVVPSHRSHIRDLILIALALPLKHHVTFAVVDEYAQIVRDRLEPYRPLTMVSLGSLLKSKEPYELRHGESNLQFMKRVELPYFLNDYIQTHDPLLAHLQNHSYDMMILDFFAFAAQDLAHDLNVPMVIHSSIAIIERPDFPAWIPKCSNYCADQQLHDSFFERFYNQVVTQVLKVYYFGSFKDTFNRLRRSFNRTISKTAYGFITQHWDDHPVLFSNTIAMEFRHTYKPNHFFLGFMVDDQKKIHVSKIFDNLANHELFPYFATIFTCFFSSLKICQNI